MSCKGYAFGYTAEEICRCGIENCKGHAMGYTAEVVCRSSM